MRVAVFASGSSGNCLLISDGDTNILVDAGISMRRVVSALAGLGISMEKIGGVLITHEHSDHVSGLKMLEKHYHIPVFAPHTVANRLLGAYPELSDEMRIIPVGEAFRIGSLTLRAFHTPHDTDESVGYRAEGGGVFAIATDMGHVTDEVREALSGADTVLIESNHDETMLCDGPYPVWLKRRILSDRGHLSNENCAALAGELCGRGTRRIILGHLSRENNVPALALACTGAVLEGTGAELYCAPVSGCLCVEV